LEKLIVLFGVNIGVSNIIKNKKVIIYNILKAILNGRSRPPIFNQQPASPDPFTGRAGFFLPFIQGDLAVLIFF
jgi:hypothetical protein